MWNFRRGTQMFLVTFACVALTAGTAGAAGIDLASEFLSGTEIAAPGDEATYTVKYSNLSATDASASYLNVDFPVGAFINDEEFDVSYEDTLGNEAGLYISSSCENLLIQLQGPGSGESDVAVPLYMPANTEGELTLSMMLPMEQPTTRAVRVQYPDGDPQDLIFSIGVCDDCSDLTTCFGPRISSIVPPLMTEYALVDDAGPGGGTLGCVSIKNDIAGKIALVRRGDCEFGLKAMNSQIAGAVGCVIMNNDPGQDIQTFSMAGGEFGALVNIPVAIINNSEGDPMQAAIEDGQTLMGIMGGAEAESLVYDSTIFHGSDSLDDDPDPTNDISSWTTMVSTGPLPPTAMFSVVTDGLMATFTDESTGAPTSWAWDFGDGAGTSTEQSPVYTYAMDGTYTVALTATNDAGSTDYSMDVTVAMGGVAPTAAFTYTADMLTATFMDASTGDPTSWEWDFGDEIGASLEQNPVYTYAAAGTYDVVLIASNDAGSSTATMAVTVTEMAPEVDASFTYTADMLTATFMDASTGDPTMWAWDFGDGAGTSTEQNPSYTYAEAGTYTVMLTASNDMSSDDFSMDVMVEDAPVFECENIFVAAGGSAPGLGDSMWATDAGINNLSADPIMYAFKFFPRGADNGEVEMTDTYTLAGNASVGYADIWMAMTAEAGFGAFAVCSDMPMYTGVNTRTYNTSAVGTFGQAIPGKTMLIGQEKVRLGFLSQNDMFRTNVGFMNGMGEPVRIGVEFFAADGTSLGTDEVGLLPYSNNQWTEAFKRVTEDAVDFGYVDVWAETDNAGFLVYASIVDGATGDPTTIWPF